MYLAMARVAHREGYPEIGLYWEKAAYEEAEHAAKFAELLGEVVTDSTKKNLEMRVDAENGATQGKTDLATPIHLCLLAAGCLIAPHRRRGLRWPVRMYIFFQDTHPAIISQCPQPLQQHHTVENTLLHPDVQLWFVRVQLGAFSNPLQAMRLRWLCYVLPDSVFRYSNFTPNGICTLAFSC